MTCDFFLSWQTQALAAVGVELSHTLINGTHPEKQNPGVDLTAFDVGVFRPAQNHQII
ncbi:MAG: hypothetical protein ABIU96_07635 [Rhodanobacter sp.]